MQYGNTCLCGRVFLPGECGAEQCQTLAGSGGGFQERVFLTLQGPDDLVHHLDLRGVGLDGKRHLDPTHGIVVAGGHDDRQDKTLHFLPGSREDLNLPPPPHLQVQNCHK